MYALKAALSCCRCPKMFEAKGALNDIWQVSGGSPYSGTTFVHMLRPKPDLCLIHIV